MRASNFIAHVQSLLGDPDGDFHTTEKVLLHLNTAIEDICTRSRTICTWQYMQAIEDQGMYGMGEEFLEFKFVGFYYRDQLIPLTPSGITDAAPAVFSDRYKSYNRIPLNYAEGGNAYIEKVVTTVALSASHELVYPGVGTGLFVANAEIPTVLAGDRLINITDNSEGVISAVDNSNGRITYENLANGEDNEMATGDEFRILSRTESRHSLLLSPPPRQTDARGAESIYVFFARTHKPIEMTHLENRNDELEIGTEWHSPLRHRVCYYMALEEKGIDNNQTIQFNVLYETEYMKAFPKANRRIRELISAWKSKRRGLPPRVVITQVADHSVRNPTVS